MSNNINATERETKSRFRFDPHQEKSKFSKDDCLTKQNWKKLIFVTHKIIIECDFFTQYIFSFDSQMFKSSKNTIYNKKSKSLYSVSEDIRYVSNDKRNQIKKIPLDRKTYKQV